MAAVVCVPGGLSTWEVIRKAYSLSTSIANITLPSLSPTYSVSWHKGYPHRPVRQSRCQHILYLTWVITWSQDEAVLDGSFSLDPIDVLGVPQTYDYFDIPDLFFFEDLCPESTSEVIVSGISPTHMGALEATAAPPEKGNMTSPQHISEADTQYVHFRSDYLHKYLTCYQLF